MTPQGLAQLRLDEGCRLAAYPDPDSPLARALARPEASRPAGWSGLSGAPYTCGYGCTGPDITAETRWTQAKADAELLVRVAQVEQHLTQQHPWFTELQAQSPVRADVLTNIAFNIGAGGLDRWTHTLGAVQAGRYGEAADNMLQNHVWRSQVHMRCDRCAAAMRAGAWGPVPTPAPAAQAVQPENS